MGERAHEQGESVDGSSGAGDAVDSLRAIAKRDAGGLTVHIAGPLGYAADSGKAFKGIDSTLLFSALAVVIVLLLITYRSPVLWLLPVIAAGVALTSSQALIYVLARNGLTVNAQSAGILDVLVFGAGPTMPCCWWPGTARSCGGTRTGTRPCGWRSGGPAPPWWPAAAR
jgi:uncharacterized membrane protein YdfJ with MMPL/SSD domain